MIDLFRHARVLLHACQWMRYFITKQRREYVWKTGMPHHLDACRAWQLYATAYWRDLLLPNREMMLFIGKPKGRSKMILPNKKLLCQSGMLSWMMQWNNIRVLEEIWAIVAAVVLGTSQTQSNTAAALTNVCSTRWKHRELIWMKLTVLVPLLRLLHLLHRAQARVWQAQAFSQRNSSGYVGWSQRMCWASSKSRRPNEIQGYCVLCEGSSVWPGLTRDSLSESAGKADGHAKTGCKCYLNCLQSAHRKLHADWIIRDWKGVLYDASPYEPIAKRARGGGWSNLQYVRRILWQKRPDGALLCILELCLDAQPGPPAWLMLCQ